MSISSVSRIRGTIELRDKGICECEFIRHLAPLSVGSIVRALPLEGRVIIDDNYVGLVTNLSLGAEKQRDTFKKGDMAFMVANNAICIFKKDVRLKGFNPIGRVLSNIDILEKASMGDIMIIKS
jgi:hypothetical protein